MEQIGTSAVAETNPSYPFLASNEKILMELIMSETKAEVT